MVRPIVILRYTLLYAIGVGLCVIVWGSPVDGNTVMRTMLIPCAFPMFVMLIIGSVIDSFRFMSMEDRDENRSPHRDANDPRARDDDYLDDPPAPTHGGGRWV